MKELLAAATAMIVAALAMACGGGGSGNAATPSPGTAIASPNATAQPATTRIAIFATQSPPATRPSQTAVATPTIASAAEIASAVATVKQNLPGISDKAKSGDLQGAKDAVGTTGPLIEIIVNATRPMDAMLARSIELRKLALDDETTATPPDPIIIIQNAIELGPLVDQAATELHVAPSR